MSGLVLGARTSASEGQVDGLGNVTRTVTIPYTAAAGNKVLALVYTGIAPTPVAPRFPIMSVPGMMPLVPWTPFDGGAGQVQQIAGFLADVGPATQNVWTVSVLASFLCVLLLEITGVLPGLPNASSGNITLGLSAFPSPAIVSTRPSLCVSAFFFRGLSSSVLLSQAYTNAALILTPPGTTASNNDLYIAGMLQQTSAGTTNDVLGLSLAQSGATATLAFGVPKFATPVPAVNKTCTVCGSTVFCGGPICPNTTGLLPNSPDNASQISTPYISVAARNPNSGRLVPQVA